jgi:hypothetical protein
MGRDLEVFCFSQTAQRFSRFDRFEGYKSLTREPYQILMLLRTLLWSDISETLEMLRQIALNREPNFYSDIRDR